MVIWHNTWSHLTFLCRATSPQSRRATPPASQLPCQQVLCLLHGHVTRDPTRVRRALATHSRGALSLHFTPHTLCWVKYKEGGVGSSVQLVRVETTHCWRLSGGKAVFYSGIYRNGGFHLSEMYCKKNVEIVMLTFL